MSAFISRLKQWIGLENLTYTDINDEFNNIIQKLGSDTLSSANSTNGSAPTVNAMRATQDPGGVGSENLAMTIQDDIQQIRYQIDSMIGGTYWYSSPLTTIDDLFGLVNALNPVNANRVVSGRVDANGQPMYLIPNGVSNGIKLEAAPVELQTYIENIATNFTADLTLTGLSLAPSVNNTCLVNDLSLSGQQSSYTQGEGTTVINIDTIGSNISALNGQYAAFKVGSEYFIGQVDTTNNVLKNCFRGFFFDENDTWIAREPISNNDVITLMRLTWVFVTNLSDIPALDITYNRPTTSYDQPLSPVAGDYWLDLSANQWKKFNGTSFINQEGVLIGVCIQDTANTVGARSFDFANAFNAINTIQTEVIDADIVRATVLSQKISVYGSSFSYAYDLPSWDFNFNLDTGLTRTVNTYYYLYVTNLGDVVISDVAPYFRTVDLFGYYHPSKPWRAIAYLFNNSADQIQAGSLVPYENSASGSSSTGVDAYNYLYNSNFDFWQRGTTLNINNTISSYLADRWYVTNTTGTSGVLTFSRVAGVSTGAKYGARVVVQTAPIALQNNGIELYQTLDNEDTITLLDKTMFFSIKVKAVGNINTVGIQFMYKTTEQKVDTALGTEVISPVNTSTFTTITIPGQAIGTLPTTNGVIGVRIRTLTASSGNTYDLGNGFEVEQAHLGIVSGSSFILPNYQRQGKSIYQELEGCQRYYEKSYNLSVNPGSNVGNLAAGEAALYTANDSAQKVFTVFFKVTKRTTPTGYLYDTAGNGGTGSNGRVTIDSTDNHNANPGVVGQSSMLVLPSAGPTYSQIHCHWAADAEIF